MKYGIKKASTHKAGYKTQNLSMRNSQKKNLVQRTQVTALSTLEFIRTYARLGFLTRTDDGFLSFSPKYLKF